jgi:Glycosyltransferase family 87
MSPYAPESVAPTRIDPVAVSASEIIGGPLGRYSAAARRIATAGWQPAAAVLVGLSSLTVALGVLQKGHCFTKGWSNPDQFWHACYSDLPVSSGIGHEMPYLPGAPHLDQPLISGLVMWLVGRAVPDGSVFARQQWYFALWAILIALVVMALVVVTAASVPRAPWHAAHVALSPVLVLAGLVSVDLFGVLLASVALWAWGRSKILLAGLVLGLAISARTYPLVLLVAIGLLALRSGRMGAWSRLAGTAMATWLAVSLPWLVTNADGLLAAYRTWWRSAAGYGSLWMVSGLLGQSLPQGSVTGLVILGWVVAVLVGAAFALSLDRRPTVAEVSLVMLVIVVVTSKAVPVQAGLWLLPLIALVGLTWRDHLIWAGLEATYFVAVWLYIAGISTPDRGLPSGFYSLLTLLRMAAWLFVLVQVWRVAKSRPLAVSSEPAEQKSVEQDEEVDQLAGPMAGAPDEVLVRIS